MTGEQFMRMVDRAREERPIVFTITYSDSGYWIRTRDSRSKEPYDNIYCGELFAKMTEITEKYNAKGFAVLFEVD